jgi:uncharacterized membrane protein YedE/YeeE
MTEFTPFSAFLGGSMIGLSALLLMLLVGRVAGCSGIIANTLSLGKDAAAERPWRICFVLGLIIGPLIASFFTDYALPTNVELSPFTIVVAGLLVGVGAALGNGCTSGHGICGMGRLSTRSIIATCTFMATAFITVFIVNHLI